MAQAAPIRTVGELIERLQAVEPDAPIRLQQALSDFIVGVGIIPNMPGTIGVVYMPSPGEGN
jgi:hypothetical protein